MDDFAVKMDVPNLYSLIQGPADAIAPGELEGGQDIRSHYGKAAGD
jgi:hypothetical protein